jgi:hypothetical protein
MCIRGLSAVVWHIIADRVKHAAGRRSDLRVANKGGVASVRISDSVVATCAPEVIMRRLFLALPLAVCPLFPALAAGDGKPAEELTCSNVVKAGDTAKTLEARYKGQTSIEEIAGAEGATAKALALFGKDPSRKLYVSFFDDEMTKLSAVGPAEGATHWTIAGLKIGAALEEVVKANGGKFELSGFEWDYGGYVTDLKGGKLSSLDGGCMVTIRFNPPEGKAVPESLSGDRSIPSSDAKLAKLKPTVSDIQLGWPGEDGGTSAD